MNTNFLVKASTLRDIGRYSPITRKARTIKNKQNPLIGKMVQTLLWLLKPESSEDLPIPVPEQNSTTANSLKTLFWVAISIGTALLLAQLN